MQKLYYVGLLFMVAALSPAVAVNKVIKLSQPVVSDALTDTYGAALNESLPSVTLTSLIESPNTYLGDDFLLSTQVSKVCQKKGCFFVAQEGEHIVRVSFLDYAFFLPTDIAYKNVTLNGVLIEKEMSEKQLKHFKKDLDTQNSGLKTGKVYEIVASSVRVPK